MRMSWAALAAVVIGGVMPVLAGCAAPPEAPIAAASPLTRPAAPPVTVVAAAVGQRLDAMLAADLAPTHHP